MDPSDDPTVTHPPLTDDDLAYIAARRHSEDAIALLREIERLKVVEARAVHLCRVIEGTGGWQPQHLRPFMNGIDEASKGKMPSAMKFGRKPGKPARR